MKKIFLTLAAVLFTTVSFSNTSIVLDDPHTVITSCGAEFSYDDDGISIDDQFLIAEVTEDLKCPQH